MFLFVNYYALQIEELREQLTTEKETAVEREREAARTRFEKQLKEELEAMQSQRRRLLADVHDEKERLAQQSAKLRTDLDRVRMQSLDYFTSLGNHIQLFTSTVFCY